MGRPISLQPSTQLPMRNATRLLSMVHELHKAGYQRIRFCSGMAPSGMHWRCHVTYAGNVATDGFTLIDRGNPEHVADYSTGSGDTYFGWPDASGCSAKELAVRFIERFPIIAQKGDGVDLPYAGWLTDILGKAELGDANSLPVFFADYPIEPIPNPPPSPDSIVEILDR